MAPPLKGLLTPHILNICSCLIHYHSQLRFRSNFSKLFALVEKIQNKRNKKKIFTIGVSNLFHTNILLCFLPGSYCHIFIFAFCSISGSCKKVYLYLHVRFVSSKVAEVFIKVNC